MLKTKFIDWDRYKGWRKFLLILWITYAVLHFGIRGSLNGFRMEPPKP